MNKQHIALITGSCGLIGSESVHFFIKKGFTVIGIDNDMRGAFFGKEGSTNWLRNKLIQMYPDKYFHISADIRDEKEIDRIFRKYPFDLIIHTAAQPSHDWAGKNPVTDFSINAYATILLLESFRKYCPKAVFIFTSSSKVYGDRPNSLPFIEYEDRYDLNSDHRFYEGIDESMSIDNSMHSIYGASKVAADIMVQEYGKYYNLYTGVFRGNCMTGSAHSATSMHGFLSYLVMCIKKEKEYEIFGYKGKQVRDNIHSYDFVNGLYQFFLEPGKGEAYNLGGSRSANISIIEAIKIIEQLSKTKSKIKLNPEPKRGDHIWYITNNKKFQSRHTNWKLTYSIHDTIQEILNNGYFLDSSIKQLNKQK